MGKSVPVGYKERWAYRGVWKEKKTRKGLWNFEFTATKRRKAKSYGNFGKGTTGIWDIRGKQYIRKIGKGAYQTKFVGTKRPIKFRVKTKRRK